MAETISPKYTFVKEGVFYFSRRIPKELCRYYSSSRIAFSLRTHSVNVAATIARRAADQLDEYRFHLKSKDAQLRGKYMLRLGAANSAVAPVVLNETSAASVLLSEAVEIYLTQKGQGRPVTFHRGAERTCGYVIDACGDKHLEVYIKADVNG
ncbi:DUF6538 domain-containing protein [Ruegeria sp. HKCCD7559]|uniref:DUF6538 domain-containing protein n=1 Tax=Ruegeria sp. HKCCD7559 TaxID=2683005 RepID=UPI0014913EF0|nr:DUF6538 domain-containing protein [Ruegeria sp. HKCCD7559]NOC43913.1 hypothetical protein [Ruegeria sp. HKCCD7559]